MTAVHLKVTGLATLVAPEAGVMSVVAVVGQVVTMNFETEDEVLPVVPQAGNASTYQ